MPELSLTTGTPTTEAPTGIYSRRESAVRSYCRRFDRVFVRAKGSVLTDVDGHSYLDSSPGPGR